MRKFTSMAEDRQIRKRIEPDRRRLVEFLDANEIDDECLEIPLIGFSTDEEIVIAAGGKEVRINARTLVALASIDKRRRYF